MPRQINPHKFIQRLLPVVRQCSEASLSFYGNIVNLGKTFDKSLSGAKAQEASGVLTALDNAIQDIILTIALQHYPEIRCIAEENTILKRRFRGNRSEYAIILDPIDGTLHFQRGDAPFHISVGLCKNGQMQAAIVARPSEKKIFTAVRGQGAYVQIEQSRPLRLRLGKIPKTKAAFVSSKARDYQSLIQHDLEPREHPIGAALVLTMMAEGNLCAYLTRQVEVYDVGPPSLIADEAGARCFVRGGGSPSYLKNRKFPYYMAAATTEIQEQLKAAIGAGNAPKGNADRHS